jgi:hypothetical protein
MARPIAKRRAGNVTAAMFSRHSAIAAHNVSSRDVAIAACVPDHERTNNGNYATAVVTLRTANDSITRVTPLMIMLTPTRTPIAQAELIGHCM